MAGSCIVLHVCVLSALRHLYSCDFRYTSFLIRFWTHSRLERAFVLLSEENKKSEPFSYREKVRIFMVWCTKKNQYTLCAGFSFFVCAMEGARTGRRRIAPQAISPVGCCLARGFQRVGMSTVEAVNRKISWLFCFISHGCTVSARFLHGRCYPCPIM